MTAYLLPTGKRYNPFTREGEYADPDLVAYVVRHVPAGPGGGSLRVATSCGLLNLEIGENLEVVHDQTRRRVGTHVVVGICHRDGSVSGEVPDSKLPHWVFK